MTRIYNINGFKLLSLKIMGSSLAGNANLFYSFVDSTDDKKSIYTTVLIGSNGTGKSNLFRIIIELLKELNDLSRGKNRTYGVDGRFNLKYSLDGLIYEYTNIIYLDGTFKYDGQPELDKQNPDKSNRAYLRINGEKQDDFSKAVLPQAIVANSIMLTDKFPFFKKESNENGEKVDAFPIYKYLGVRNISQSASTRAYIRRTVEFIVRMFEYKDSNKDFFLSVLRRATEFLELENSIDIVYYTAYTTKFFNGKLSLQILEEYFEEIRAKYPKNPPFKLNQYLKIKEDKALLESICDFCNRLYNEKRLGKAYSYSSSRKIIYNLISPQSFKQLNTDYPILEHLRQLGMVYAPEIELKRQNSSYSLHESSSGEYHFFSSIVGLMASINPTNSLVLIDEPEISLHPNWQMRYHSFLREIFNDPAYGSCHIMIATHSHFLISDLKGDNSKIIGLRKVEGKTEIVDVPQTIDTFGWSAEDVLYKIFGLRTTRNYYMEVDMRELLHSISEKKENKEDLEKILNRLEQVKLDSMDPLNDIIKRAREYIDKL